MRRKLVYDPLSFHLLPSTYNIGKAISVYSSTVYRPYATNFDVVYRGLCLHPPPARNFQSHPARGQFPYNADWSASKPRQKYTLKLFQYQAFTW